VQGYNAQAVVNECQIILAAEITNDPGDFSHLRPMIQSISQRLAVQTEWRLMMSTHNLTKLYRYQLAAG
jgi:hypothetical protein